MSISFGTASVLYFSDTRWECEGATSTVKPEPAVRHLDNTQLLKHTPHEIPEQHRSSTAFSKPGTCQ